MALTDAGALVIAKLLMGDTQTLFNNANARVGVGDSTTAFNKTQTDLVASTNKLRKAMDTSYPTRTNATLTFRSTFGTSEANFAWQEWGVFNAGSAGDMLNRKVESLGTKTNAQSWQFTVDLAVTAP